MTDWPLDATDDYNGSGCYYYTIRMRFYANTPWFTASLKYVCNGTIDYDLMLVGVHSDPDIMPWLTRENTTGIDTVDVTLKPGNVTRTPKNLGWTMAWNQTWADFQNTTDSGNDVGLALVNLGGAGTTAFDGLRSSDGDEGSPYWNGTCTTKAANLAIGVHTGSNYTYAQTLYTRLTNPLNYTVGPEQYPPVVIDRIVTNIDVYVNPSEPAYSGCVIRAFKVPPTWLQSYPTWLVPYKVNVTVQNEGTHPTDTFNVTAYYGNATGNYTIGSQQVNNLAPGQSTNITFSFAVPPLPMPPWPYPTYTIYGIANTSSDIDPNNNAKADGTIMVVWPGDVTADGKIGGPDLFYFAKSWYKNANNPYYDGTPATLGGYDYRCDFNMDGKVDGLDLYYLAKNWYKAPLNIL